MIFLPRESRSAYFFRLKGSGCLIELHQYVADSWVQSFGLGVTLGEVLLVVGDYRQPGLAKIQRRGAPGWRRRLPGDGRQGLAERGCKEGHGGQQSLPEVPEKRGEKPWPLGF